jgi:DNA-binding MarR family transcriptional regulator
MEDATDPAARIEAAVLALLRRANDPRGFQRIHELSGVDIERAGAVMLARIEELQPARLSELAEAAGVEVSTASRQVARLVEQGYVERAADPTDARAALHRLTPRGRRVRHKLRAAATSFFQRALVDFTEADQARLADLLGRFVEAVLDTSHRTPSG